MKHTLRDLHKQYPLTANKFSDQVWINPECFRPVDWLDCRAELIKETMIETTEIEVKPINI